MRLISISTDNQSSFKKVDFNHSGASFIIAKQENPHQSDKNKTYNGVGKSLLIALIDFCLGAKPDSKITKALKTCDSLKDWVFKLEVNIKDEPYTITRSVSDNNKIRLNNKPLKLQEFQEQMWALCFDVEQDLKFLTYRSLLPFFLRPSKTSYTEYDQPQKFGKPYQKLLYNSFLLGLDIVLVNKKMELTEQLGARENILKNIRKDPVIKEFLGYTQNTTEDYQLLRTDIEEEIKKLEKSLETFEVAKDYYQRQEEADQLKKLIDEKQNQIYMYKNNIKQIDKSLEFKVDIDQKDIKKVYEESQLVFQPSVEKRLSDLDKFYTDLKTNRTKRLEERKQAIIKELEKLEKEAGNLKPQLDNLLSFLKSHGALDVFIGLNNQLSKLKQKREKLNSYEQLQKQYKKEIEELKQDLIDENKKTTIYLEKNEKLLKSISTYFRALAKGFYPEVLTGITITNDDGKAQTRYKIEAKIQSDSSDAINSVKIFCYDLSILLNGKNHHMDFIFHDSRLFSDVDEEHCNIFFETVRSKFNDKQYIASINQKDLRNLSQPVQDFINEHKVCELNDESDEGKLLGMRIELEYD